jgi:sugar phosphate isomerase/epimerase
MSLLTRREFGKAVVAGAVGLAATSASAKPADAAERLAVSTWSFHNYFPGTRYGKPQFKLEKWSLQDVIRNVRKQLGISAFEISSAHLTSQEPKYLDELKGFVKEQKCRLIHLSDNIPGVNLARSERTRREADLRTFEQLIGTAQRLNIPTMRVNTGTPEKPKDWDFKITIECYRRLAKFARERKVEIIIENHFGLSADPKNVARIIEAVGENISACPDFGLFTRDADRWPGLALMFKHCRRICSAKFHGFGADAKGQHKDFDLRHCYRVMTESKFQGWVSLEYEGALEPMPQLVRMKALALEWLKAK